MERLNWRLAVPLTVVGLGAVTAGLHLGDYARATWSSVLIEVGAAFGLLAVLAFAEGRLLRDVATSAREAVKTETANLSERILRLEDLDEAQQAARAERVDQQTKELDEFERADLSVQTVGKLLTAAYDENLIAHNAPVRVRTGANPDCHVVYLMGGIDSSRKAWTIFLDFVPFSFDGKQYPISPGFPTIPLPTKTDTTVMWVSETAAAVAIELEDGLKRTNQPLRGFSLAFALRQLRDTLAVMRRARTADDGSPHRLKGAIELLINSEWVLTDYGLESVSTAEAYPAVLAHFSGSGPLVPRSLHLDPSCEGRDGQRSSGPSIVKGFVSCTAKTLQARMRGKYCRRHGPGRATMSVAMTVHGDRCAVRGTG